MPNQFTIEINCKRYVKAYIETNCGAPAELKHLPDLYNEFIYCLQNIPRHRNACRIAQWQEKVTIIVPADVFYRYGWEMNKENELEFNKAAEHNIKFFMRQFISVNHALGIPVTICIKEFQELYGFEESIWPFESMKKDYERNRTQSMFNSMKFMKSEINKIFLENLSELGTISKKFKKEYVNG